MSQEGTRPDRPIAPRRLRAGLLAVAAIGATAGVLIAIASGGRAVVQGLGTLPVTSLLAAFALNFASWLGEAVVFHSLAPPSRTRGDGTWGARLRSVAGMVPAYVGGGFPALVTPFGSGGVPGWVYALTRVGLLPGEAAAVVGARALLTSVFFVSAGAAALGAVPIHASGGQGAGAAGLLALAAVLAAAVTAVSRPDAVVRALGRPLRWRPLRRLLGETRVDGFLERTAREAGLFSAELRSLARRRPGALAAAVVGLLFSRACLLAILPVIMAGLGWRGSWVTVIAIVLGVQALASASPTPGGSGTTEAALTAALTGVSPAAVAGTAALLWRGVTFYCELVFGWLFFARILAARKNAAPGRS